MLHALPGDATARLLLHRPDYEALYRLLGLPILTLPRALAEVVLPRLMELPDAVQSVVLTRVLDSWQTLRGEATLVAALSGTPFVPAAPLAATAAATPATPSTQQPQQLRRAPGELYDPSHPLLSRVFRAKPVFPAGQFAFPAWLSVSSGPSLLAAVVM